MPSRHMTHVCGQWWSTQQAILFLKLRCQIHWKNKHDRKSAMQLSQKNNTHEHLALCNFISGSTLKRYDRAGRIIIFHYFIYI